eukprot:363572-Chlamydomonas_euryale.AAC.6
MHLHTSTPPYQANINMRSGGTSTYQATIDMHLESPPHLHTWQPGRSVPALRANSGMLPEPRTIRIQVHLRKAFGQSDAASYSQPLASQLQSTSCMRSAAFVDDSSQASNCSKCACV